jgi:hypothetical protein
MKLASLFALPLLATAFLAGCSGAPEANELAADDGEGERAEGAWGNVDVAAQLATQLQLGKELPSPVPTMRQFGAPSHPSRITLDAYGNVTAVRPDGGGVLDGVALGVVRTYGLKGFPRLSVAAGTTLGWELANGSIRMSNPILRCELTGMGKADPAYPQCIADAKAQLASRGPMVLGSSEGVVEAISVGTTDIPLPIAYLSYRYRTRMGTFTGKTEKFGGATFRYTGGSIEFAMLAKSWTYAASVTVNGRTTGVETCVDDGPGPGEHLTCRAIPGGGR